MEIPYGYVKIGDKLEIEPTKGAVVKHIYEMYLRYTENPPIWGEASVIGNSIFYGNMEICSVSDFVNGYIAVEANLIQELYDDEEKTKATMAEFIEDKKTVTMVRQHVEKKNIVDFCHEIKRAALYDISEVVRQIR